MLQDKNKLMSKYKIKIQNFERQKLEDNFEWLKN